MPGLLGWNYFIVEEQRWVGNASAHLALNPDHTVIEYHADDAHPAGISGADYTPDDTFVYVRTGGILHTLSLSGNNLFITPSGGPTVAVGSGSYLELEGGTMTGDLFLNGDPTVSGQAANKGYVDAQIASVSGSVINQGDLDTLSGTLQTDIDSRVLRAGDTMTGFLTLFADPTASGHAANKYYVDSLVQSGINSSNIDVKDSDSLINSGVQAIDFGFALDVTDEGGGEVRIDVNESSFVSFVTLTGNQVITGQKTFSNDVVIEGNLTVTGITTYLNTQELLVEDNLLTLNYGTSGTPSLNAGIEVDRGSSDYSQIIWNETTDRWQAGISGSLENIILESDLATLSGDISTEINNAITTYSGFAEGQFVNEAGDTMTGFLTLNADPTAALHAATKQYVDSVSGNITSDLSTLSGNLSSEIDSDIATYSGFAESQFVNIAGDIMTGFLTLFADPTASGHAANKYYVDSQASSVQPTVQIDFTVGTDLDVTQNTLPLNAGTTINPTASVYTVNSNDVSIGQEGFYKVTWNVEGERNGGASERRLLQTNLNFNGTQISSSSVSGMVRDGTNNHVSTSNSYLIEVTSPGQTVGIRSRQTGSGGGGTVTFLLSAGHLLIERIGDN